MTGRQDLTQMPPRQWLSHMRKELGFTTQSPVTMEGIDAIVEVVPVESKEATRKIWTERLNKNINNIQEEQMAVYLERQKIFSSQDQSKILEATYFGILSTRKFNAFAGFSPRGDRVVVLHEALTNVVALWCHWYARCQEAGTNILSDDSLRQDTLRFFLNLWNSEQSYQPLQTPKGIYPVGRDAWAYSEILAIACMNFIIGHEVGHISFGHVGYGPDQQANHTMEFEADSAGFDVCLRAFALSAKAGFEDGADAYLVAPFLSLAIMSIFSDRSSHTHPSSSTRFNRLVNLLEDRMKKTSLQVTHLVFEANQVFAFFAAYRDEINSIRQGDVEMDSHEWLSRFFVDGRF